MMYTWYLSSNCAPNFGLGVLQELDKRRDKIPCNDFFVDGLGNLLEAIRNHISHSPALVVEEVSEGSDEDGVTGLLFLWHGLCDGDQHLHSQESYAILVVLGKMLEKRDHLIDDNGCGHTLDEFGEVVGRLSPDHRRVIVYELSKLLPEALLRLRSGMLVWYVVEASGRDLRGEPVCLGETDGQGDEILLDLLLRQLIANLVERFNGLG